MAMLLLIANDARASTGCTAVNAGVFDLVDAPGGGSATASQAGFAVGDKLTITYNATAPEDTFALSPTGGGPDLDNFNATGPITIKSYTLTASQLSLTLTVTNGLFMQSSTTATCTPAPMPTVTAIAPNSGSTIGGTAVTITGTLFTGATSVTIGGVAATGVTVVNATTITATTPAHAAGAVDVVVTTPDGTGTGAGLFTYVAPPTVTMVNPAVGIAAGGTAVTIIGTNFTGATAVTFGGIAATGVTVVNATTITATTPAHAAGLVDVVVTTPDGTGTGIGLYTYGGVPAVTEVSPSSGPIAGGTAITITGANLNGATSVMIGGVAAIRFSVIDDTRITATTPEHVAGRVGVTVTTPSGSGSSADIYLYRAELTLTSSPSVVRQVGEPYSQANVANGGVPEYRFSVVAGSLPAGTSLDASTGVVSGTPASAGGFSYTIQVVDSDAKPATATQVVSGAIAPIQTTTSLTSSLDPSLVGQPVTLTAAVAPVPAAGTVTFKTDAATLCSAAPLASGVATCTTSFGAAGAYSVIAVYDGDAALGASTSPALLQTVNDQRARTVEAIGTFTSRRNDLIAASEPDASGQIERLVEMGDFDASVASAGSRAGEERASATPAAARVLSQLWQAFGASAGGFAGTAASSPGQMALRLASAVTGPVRMSGHVDGATRFAAATSLRQVRQYEAQNAGGGSASSRPTPFDVWIDGKYASFNDDRAGTDLDGHFRLVSIGSDYVFNRRFLVGGMVQFDSMRQHSPAQTSRVSGHGWMVGPYATVRLADTLFWQGRAAWGRSSNDVSPFDTYAEHFGSARWLLSTTLAGRLDVQQWLVRPAVSIVYVEDAARSYTDTFGVLIPEVRSGLGQAKVGPQVDRRFQINRRLALEPRAGLQLITTFGDTTAAGGLGPIDGSNAGPTGTRGRSEIGLNVITVSGLGIDLSGSYDGIGVDDYSALAGRVMVRVPFGR